MNNYYASELGLTRQTKALLAKGVPHFVYPAPDFDPKPYTKKVVPLRKVKKSIRYFQEKRIFALIENQYND